LPDLKKENMLTIKVISENTQEVLEKLAKKHFDKPEIVHEVIDTDKSRKESQRQLDNNLAILNQLSRSIGTMMKEGKREEADEAREKVAEIKELNRNIEAALKTAEARLLQLLCLIPNLPHDSVPDGFRAEDNVVEETGGRIPELSSDSLPHWELAKKYDLIDFETGVKVAGAGFPFYKGKCARLQRALIDFFLDIAREAGYEEVQPPYLVNAESCYGTGNLPDKDGQMYHSTTDNLYLIPTAEVPVTNIYRDVILNEADLPVKLSAYSACFRREAGSYGADVRGLNRLHQFDKVEIVRIDRAEHSYESLVEMTSHVRLLLEMLELPWRMLRLCGGDMSFTSALTFDFEVYSAAQRRWLEVSSVSNFESYQANRLKCRYRDGDRRIRLCHTLNGSALALPRVLAALLENNQYSGGISIPRVLVSYAGFERIN
jgi:seryl-tRNA synthetase